MFNLPYQQTPAIIELKKTAREKGFPLYGSFELTSRCNLDCKMCYVHNQDSNHCASQELTTDQWKQLMDNAINAGMLFALLTGGECLLRKDFKDLYLHLHKKGVIVSVNTNGALINDDYVEFFRTHKPERIQISLYGSNEDQYERVTRHRRFNAVLSGIQKLKNAGVNVEIAITPNAYMKDDFEGVFKLVKDEKLNYQVSNVLIAPREGEMDTTCNLTEEDRIHITKIMASVMGTASNPNRTSAPAPLPCGESSTQESGMPCNAGTIRFFLTWQGKMLPCVSMPDIFIDAMTNSFETCWTYIRDTMKEVKRPIECTGCVYEHVCALCPSVRFNGLFSGHCRKELCNYMVKKYEEGCFIKTGNGLRSI